MLRANAWPHPVADIEVSIEGATFQDQTLEYSKTTRGLVINGRPIRELSRGDIELTACISTPATEVCNVVFGADRVVPLDAAFRVMCAETKFRGFIRSSSGDSHLLKLPLERVRGVVAITPLYLTTVDTSSRDGVPIYAGGIVAIAVDPIFVTIDEDWSGDEIPVLWKPFKEPPLQPQALLHVQLSGGSVTPEIWLNEECKPLLEPVLTRTGNSPAGFAGAALREWFAVEVWEKVLVWAIETAVETEENWPATRILTMWRDRFAKETWDLPDVSQLDHQKLNELSLQIQHCLKSAQRIARVQGILRFSPESAIS